MISSKLGPDVYVPTPLTDQLLMLMTADREMFFQTGPFILGNIICLQFHNQEYSILFKTEDVV